MRVHDNGQVMVKTWSLMLSHFLAAALEALKQKENGHENFVHLLEEEADLEAVKVEKALEMIDHEVRFQTLDLHAIFHL